MVLLIFFQLFFNHFVYLFIHFMLIIFGYAGSLFLCGLFSGCGKWGLLSSCGVRLLIVVASLVVEHRLQGVRASVVGALGLSSCSAWA